MRVFLRSGVLPTVSTVVVWVLLMGPAFADCISRPESDPWVYDGQSLENLTGSGVKIAMLDSPVLEEHPAFREGSGRVLNATGQPPDVAKTPADAGEVAPHGTAVASVIHRLAPGADITVYSPRTDAYSLLGDPLNLNPFSGFADAIDQGVEDGADIFVYSGGLTGSSDLFGNQFREVEDAIRRANEKGVLFITSAGNNGTDDIFCGGGPDDDGIVGGLPVGEPLFPVEMEEVFVVGGLQQRGSDGEEPIWELWECSLEGDFVDAHAPAVDVEVARLDGDMSTASGTSFAAPAWAAHAAMILEARPGVPLELLTEIMISSTSSSREFGDQLYGGEGPPDLARLQSLLFELEYEMDAWGVVREGDRSALDGPSPGWCFALPSEDGWMDDFEVNLYRSNRNTLHVRGLGIQTSTNVRWNQGDPLPNFEFITIATPDGTTLEIANPAPSLGCAVSTGLAYASQSRHIYDALSVSPSGSPDGWCTYGAGSYSLTADLGTFGTKTTTFEITQDVLDVLCCDSTSTIGTIAAAVGEDEVGNGPAMESRGVAEEESSSTWPWIVGGLFGGIVVSLGVFLRRTGRS